MCGFTVPVLLRQPSQPGLWNSIKKNHFQISPPWPPKAALSSWQASTQNAIETWPLYLRFISHQRNLSFSFEIAFFDTAYYKFTKRDLRCNHWNLPPWTGIASSSHFLPLWGLNNSCLRLKTTSLALEIFSTGKGKPRQLLHPNFGKKAGKDTVHPRDSPFCISTPTTGIVKSSSVLRSD